MADEEYWEDVRTAEEWLAIRIAEVAETRGHKAKSRQVHALIQVIAEVLAFNGLNIPDDE